jgi:DUF4097 and DUF4098 domain-containing protein YvlB
MALGFLTGTPVPAFEQQVLRARYPLRAGGCVTVENVQGAIRVEGWDRAEVEVTVTQTGASSSGHMDPVRIAVNSIASGLGFRTLYPQESEAPVRVDYRLRVPRQVRLDRLGTVQGDITVLDIEGPVSARSLSGNIVQKNVAGRLEARTLNGNVAVSLRALVDPKASLDLDAVNGNLELILPPAPNADLELDTVAGNIEGRYAFTVSDLPGDTAQRAHLGRGGVRVRLRTVRGNIRVTERDDLL